METTTYKVGTIRQESNATLEPIDIQRQEAVVTTITRRESEPVVSRRTIIEKISNQTVPSVVKTTRTGGSKLNLTERVEESREIVKSSNLTQNI